MEIKETKSNMIEKTVYFEESGEMFFIRIGWKNISPQAKENIVSLIIDTLYERTKDEIKKVLSQTL